MSQLLDSGKVGYIVKRLRNEFPDIENEDVIKSIINTWDDTGLLHGLDGKFKRIVAIKLEELASLLVNNPELCIKVCDLDITVIALPIVRRMINEFTSFNYSLINGWGWTNDLFPDTEYVERNIMLFEILDVNMVVNKIINSIDGAVVLNKQLLSNEGNSDFEAYACALLSVEIAKIHKHQHRKHILCREPDGSITVKYKDK